MAKTILLNDIVQIWTLNLWFWKQTLCSLPICLFPFLFIETYILIKWCWHFDTSFAIDQRNFFGISFFHFNWRQNLSLWSHADDILERNNWKIRFVFDFRCLHSNGHSVTRWWNIKSPKLYKSYPESNHINFCLKVISFKIIQKATNVCTTFGRRCIVKDFLKCLILVTLNGHKRIQLH